MFGYFFWTEGRWPQSQPQPASPPAPLRMERGVICEVTPIGLLKEGEWMPNGRRESYEAVPRRPEQQGTEGPALSMALCSLFLCYHVSNTPCPCLKHTLPLSQTSVTPRTCSSVTMSQTYLVPVSNIPCPYLSPLLLPELVHLLLCLSHTLSPYPPYPVPTLSQKK